MIHGAPEWKSGEKPLLGQLPWPSPLTDAEPVCSNSTRRPVAVHGARLCVVMTAGSMMSTSRSAGFAPVLARISRRPGDGRTNGEVVPVSCATGRPRGTVSPAGRKLRAIVPDSICIACSPTGSYGPTLDPDGRVTWRKATLSGPGGNASQSDVLVWVSSVARTSGGTWGNGVPDASVAMMATPMSVTGSLLVLRMSPGAA